MSPAPQDPFAHECGRNPDELLRPVLASLADLADLPGEQWGADHLALADNIGMRLAHVYLHIAAAMTPPGLTHDTVPRVRVGNGLADPWLQTAATVWWVSAQRNGLAGLLANPLPWAAPATISVSGSVLTPVPWSTTVDLTPERLVVIAGLPITGEIRSPRQMDHDGAQLRLHAWMSAQIADTTPVQVSTEHVLSPGQAMSYPWDAVTIAGALTFRAVTMAHTVATLHGRVQAAPPRIPLTPDLTVPWPTATSDSVTFDLYSTMTSHITTAGLGDK